MGAEDGELGPMKSARGQQSAVRAVLVLAAALSAGLTAVTPTAGAAQPRSRPVTVRLEASSPSNGEQRALGTAPIRIRFSTTVDPRSPLPTIVPSIAGHWMIAGRTITFAPAGAYPPASDVTVIVPGGRAGIESTNGARLRSNETIKFTVENGSMLRAEQLLAGLGYLPVAWRAHRPVVRGIAQFEKAVFVPPPGRFVFIGQAPTELRELWRPGVSTPILQAALSAFDRRQGLPLDGQLSSKFWSVILRLGYHPARFAAPNGFTYALVSKKLPESLTIFQNGRVVLQTPANTGIAQSPTPDGTYAVYLRYQNQVMSGTSPWGSPYSDPVSWVAYFNGSDAVHYIYRASYGFPQSFGCVELPLPAAERAWGYLTLGTIVTVTG